MAFPGAILPAWGYHIRDEFINIGRYFLAMFGGLMLSVPAAKEIMDRWDVRTAVLVGCGIAGAAFLWLGLATPPAHWSWRAGGLLWIGVAAGMLNNAAFRSLTGLYDRDPAATVNMAGTAFGSGCALIAFLVSSAFYVYTVPATLALIAVAPLVGAGLYRKSQFANPARHAEKSWRDVWAEVRSPGAVIFSLLLFVQFANEWTVAGWLPVFLVRRTGVNPETSLTMLTVYWLSLMAGRIATQALLVRVKHWQILAGSVFGSILGSVILASTKDQFGAWTGLLLLGLGFAPVYPLVVEKIGHRFPEYHPGVFNGLLSVGISGGLLTPFLMGYFADWLGVWVVMALPMAGTVAVSALIVLLWLETKFLAARAS